MFVVSVKTGYKQILAALGCIAVLAVALVAASVMPKSVSVSGAAQVTDVAGRVAYLRAHGCEVVEASEEVREMQLPDEPDEAITRYCQQVGASFEPYYGKRVRLYSYDTANDSKAHLYVYRDRVVAGDIEEEGVFKKLQ